VIAAIDETGQEKTGAALMAGVKRQYMGYAGRVANGINAVHVSLVGEKTGHALVGRGSGIAREQIEDPATSLVMGQLPDLGFRTEGQLALSHFGGDEVRAQPSRIRWQEGEAGAAVHLPLDHSA
jgi:hypothetical protein